MTSQIQCTYAAVAAGVKTPAALVTLMAAVPLDSDLLTDYGLRSTADSTAAVGNVVSRVITVSMNPGVSAAATAVLASGVSSFVEFINMTANGSDYVAPPVVTLSAPIAGSRQALAHANLGVASVSVSAGGAAYSAQSFAVFSKGQVPPGSADATVTLTIVAGVITAVTVVTAGGPYGRIPTVTVVDPTGAGSGAVLVAHLGVASVTIDDPGNGYPTAPTVTIQPLFHALFPDAGDQVSPLSGWMTEVLQQGILSPVVAFAPVVS
jgi:hypothetical protein